MTNLSICYYPPGKPVGDEPDLFERNQRYNQGNVETRVTPLSEMYDPGDEFIEQFVEVEMTGPLATRLHAESVRLDGQYTHLPGIEQARQRKISQIESNDEAEKAVEIALANARRMAIQRSMNSQQNQMME
jgi:hypothetical protein